MTIADAVAMGLTGVYLCCRECHREGRISFEALTLPAETPVPAIARARRFVCSGCGARSVASLPDWSGYRAPGMGRM
jgi:hypothetical protein